jgi:hypothetical protein
LKKTESVGLGDEIGNGPPQVRAGNGSFLLAAIGEDERDNSSALAGGAFACASAALAAGAAEGKDVEHVAHDISLALAFGAEAGAFAIGAGFHFGHGVISLVPLK